VKQASEDELAAVPRISRRDAALVVRFFRAAEAEPVKDGEASADPSGAEGS